VFYMRYFRMINSRSLRCAHNTLVGKLERKKLLRKPKRRWKDTIKTNLEANRVWRCDWIHLARDIAQWRSLVNTVVILRDPSKAGNMLTSWATVRFLKNSASRSCLRIGVNVKLSAFLGSGVACYSFDRDVSGCPRTLLLQLTAL
jgi:hypothetical protein